MPPLRQVQVVPALVSVPNALDVLVEAPEPRVRRVRQDAVVLLLLRLVLHFAQEARDRLPVDSHVPRPRAVPLDAPQTHLIGRRDDAPVVHHHGVGRPPVLSLGLRDPPLAHGPQHARQQFVELLVVVLAHEEGLHAAQHVALHLGLEYHLQQFLGDPPPPELAHLGEAAPGRLDAPLPLRRHEACNVDQRAQVPRHLDRLLARHCMEVPELAVAALPHEERLEDLLVRVLLEAAPVQVLVQLGRLLAQLPHHVRFLRHPRID
mmetsp:Transcript_52145/g.148663  ORF Transcript_52145/g.148663 Transcript_52145/m.148663 type:complete len:263 (+) Transcript_52145:327-1115(+)